ncbi:MAG: hypothetical protein IT368_15085 [Candidatus Hydrogenedentes bacterium]|nr:hypothetical protein [Candidatus Hydrogenedentota bacterium]
MSQDRNCWYIPAEGENPAALRKSVQFLARRKDPNGPGVLLAIDSKNMLKSGPLVALFGPEICDELARKESADVEQLGPVTVQSLHKNNPLKRSIYRWRGPVLAVQPSRELLQYIDALEGALDVIIVPWFMKEVDEWIRQWNAHNILDAPSGPGAV